MPSSAEIARRASLRTWRLQTPGLSPDERLYSLALSSTSAEDGTLLVETVEAARIDGGDFPDEVSVRNVRITVDRTTGEMWRTAGPVVATEREICE